MKETTRLPLDVACANWLADMTATLDEATIRGYTTYARAHWRSFFRSVERITESNVDAYMRTRLRCVRRTTLLKELSALRGFLGWCRLNGIVTHVPAIRSPARSATGVEYGGGSHRKVRVELTEDEAQAVLAALPEETRGGLHPKAFFEVMYETTLRRGTLVELRAPLDYAKGRSTLTIRDEADKNRYGRVVPLSPRARVAFDRVCPEEGAIFPRVGYRNTLQAAAKKAGLSDERARHLSYHDWRHASLTHMASTTTDLTGMAYLAGMRDVNTLSRYVHGHQKAAERALAAREKARST